MDVKVSHGFIPLLLLSSRFISIISTPSENWGWIRLTWNLKFGITLSAPEGGYSTEEVSDVPRPIWIITLLMLLLCTAASMSRVARLPEGDNGIAARYPGDKGIENDPSVIFVEKFDKGSLEAVFDRWDNIKGRKIMSLSSDVPKGGADRWSLMMRHVGGEGTGGHLYRRLLPGYKRLFARFYVPSLRNASGGFQSANPMTTGTCWRETSRGGSVHHRRGALW